MGIDLTPVPVRRLESESELGPVLGYDRLSLDRHYGLWELVKALPSEALTVPLWHYGDGGILRTTEDAYGTPLRHVDSRDLARLLPEVGRTSDWNRSILAWLSLAPPMRVVLWWH